MMPIVEDCPICHTPFVDHMGVIGLCQQVVTWRKRACLARDVAHQASMMLDPQPGKELMYHDVDKAREVLDECVADSAGWIAELRAAGISTITGGTESNPTKAEVLSKALGNRCNGPRVDDGY